jgi:hypothetical protein
LKRNRVLNPKRLVLAGVVCITLTACGSAGQDNAEPESSDSAQSVSATPSNEFTWTQDILYNATLEGSIIDAWGYKNINGESSIGLFSEAPDNKITNYYSDPKPSECAPILDLYVARKELDAEYYSVVDHYNENPTDFTSFTLFIFTYPSEQKAIDHFQSALNVAPNCGKFDAIKKGEIIKVDLWDEPTILEQNLIQGQKGISTDTYGITGSTIWTLSIIDVNDPNKALEVSNQAIPVIQERLQSAQNLS